MRRRASIPKGNYLAPHWRRKWAERGARPPPTRFRNIWHRLRRGYKEKSSGGFLVATCPAHGNCDAWRDFRTFGRYWAEIAVARHPATHIAYRNDIEWGPPFSSIIKAQKCRLPGAYSSHIYCIFYLRAIMASSSPPNVNVAKQYDTDTYLRSEEP